MSTMTIIDNIDMYVESVSIYDRYLDNVKPNVYFLGFIGEIGELCEAIVQADDDPDEWKAKVVGELGDILWYWFGLAKSLKLNYKSIWNTTIATNDPHIESDSEILRIVGSAGRVIEHLKKSIRDDNGEITPERLQKIELKMIKTLGHIVSFCNNFDVDPYEVLQKNYAKLSARNEAGGLQGEGEGITKEERS